MEKIKITSFKPVKTKKQTPFRYAEVIVEIYKKTFFGNLKLKQSCVKTVCRREIGYSWFFVETGKYTGEIVEELERSYNARSWIE